MLVAMDTVPHDLQTWIATNLMAGCDPQQMVATLIQLGASETLARDEIAAAAAHPYMLAGQQIFRRFQRRESLLKTLDAQQRQRPGFGTLERQPLPSFETFLNEYYYVNRPGLFTGAFDHWPARQWTPAKLLEKVGPEPVIQLQLNREAAADYEQRAHSFQQDMTFGEFIGRMETTFSSNDFYLTARNRALANGALSVLTQDMGIIGDGYLTGNHADAHLWVGPRGIVTPLHHDLTNNLFLQVYGKKRFRMVPSMQVPYMANNDNHVFSDFALGDPELLQRWPEFGRTTLFDFTVEPGDALFIPIGWWHHVVGITASISLSFTTFNVPNRFVDYPSGSSQRM